MKEDPKSAPLQVAAVSERGLSEKRPLNEDSFLSDPERRIFAVADGVGGAQAGEVASQTAVEVLDEAFRHHIEGGDIEDLMEIAIQRANSSIHQMAREHPKLAAMATTVVALHLDGHIATIGHVGDSRLYRLSPDGNLYRETADHSVVEEEVRAGRMTPEQAAHHPSRNVISRALGAEAGVDVDMKTIEVEDGTAFLLCSDGITRHIPDNEIRELLAGSQDTQEVCAEMKRRCYERGAEDNLTAVVVRVGRNALADTLPADNESTIEAARLAMATTVDISGNPPPGGIAAQTGATPAVPPPTSAVAPPHVNEPDGPKPNPILPLNAQNKSHPRKSGGRAFLLMLLIIGIGAGAFYGGIYFQRRQTGNTAQANTSATPAPTTTPADPVAEFEKRRQLVDKAPAVTAKSLRDERPPGEDPLVSANPEFLYLYGRALLLMGDNQNALLVFLRAIDVLKEIPAPSEDRLALYDKLRVESRVGALAALHRLRSKALPPDPNTEQKAIRAFDEWINQNVNSGS